MLWARLRGQLPRHFIPIAALREAVGYQSWAAWWLRRLVLTVLLFLNNRLQDDCNVLGVEVLHNGSFKLDCQLRICLSNRHELRQRKDLLDHWMTRRCLVCRGGLRLTAYTNLLHLLLRLLWLSLLCVLWVHLLTGARALFDVLLLVGLV